MKSQPKPQRVKNRQLLDEVKSKPCVVCGKGPSDPDHLATRGSGGNDELSNLWPLCRQHHTEKHQIGLNTFIRRYPHLALELKRKGWEFCNVRKKWANNTP